MAKNIVRLTESELKRVISESVKRVLNEGFGWDTLKNIRQNINGSERPTWDEFKELIKGEPDAEKFKRSKDRYNAAKEGTLYDPEAYSKRGGMKGIEDYEAEQATFTEPGMKGKLRRGAIGAGAYANYLGKKIRNRFSK
jgi:hypothetical protein